MLATRYGKCTQVFYSFNWWIHLIFSTSYLTYCVSRFARYEERNINSELNQCIRFMALCFFARGKRHVFYVERLNAYAYAEACFPSSVYPHGLL